MITPAKRIKIFLNFEIPAKVLETSTFSVSTSIFSSKSSGVLAIAQYPPTGNSLIEKVVSLPFLWYKALPIPIENSGT